MSEERTAPVNGCDGMRIPWAVHLRCYEGYCKEFRSQKALIEGDCRGGFGVIELDRWAPGWREESFGWNTLQSSLAAANERIAKLERMVKHEAEDWSEVDDALEKAGVVMNHDGYRKTHVEAVEELGAKLAKIEAAASKSIDELEDRMKNCCYYEGHTVQGWPCSSCTGMAMVVEFLRQALTPKE